MAPQVATILDDSAVGSSTTFAGEPGLQLDLLPYDIERIEILRGPQGTLYGADSMSGVLKYVTKYPSLTGYEAQIGGELFGIKGGGSPGYGARASLGAPLIDGILALRASAYDQQTPGYIRNASRGTNHDNTLAQRGARLAVLWQPSTNLTNYAQKGMFKEFASEMGEAFALYGYPELAARLRHAYDQSGGQGTLREWIKELEHAAVNKENLSSRQPGGVLRGYWRPGPRFLLAGRVSTTSWSSHSGDDLLFQNQPMVCSAALRSAIWRVPP